MPRAVLGVQAEAGHPDFPGCALGYHARVLSTPAPLCLISVALALGALHCTPPPAPPSTPVDDGHHAARPTMSDVAEPTRLPGGSSDGVTCEEARDAHPDEVGIGARHSEGPEPPDNEFSEPLSKGTYLDECEVGEQTKVSVCAAVMDGKAAGVTVATSPSDAEKEKCVAGKIRGIGFPSHPRLRVVRTSF